ncbi:MAG TPA: hypothetical protein PLN52_01620 [Opitutaceae bacterium]|nr:hypothetical protein [Opitutaceae bacterium]
MNVLTDNEVIAALSHNGAHVEDYVLISEGEDPSTFTGRRKRGLFLLHVEHAGPRRGRR